MKHNKDSSGIRPANVLKDDLYDQFIWRLTNWRWFTPDNTQSERIDMCLSLIEDLKTNRARLVFEYSWKSTWPDDFNLAIARRQSDKDARKRLLKTA